MMNDNKMMENDNNKRYFYPSISRRYYIYIFLFGVVIASFIKSPRSGTLVLVNEWFNLAPSYGNNTGGEIVSHFLVHHSYPSNLSFHLNELVSGPGLNDTRTNKQEDEYALCSFVANGFMYHFPHTCEQIFLCWSWWRSVRKRKKNKNKNVQLVLIWPNEEDLIYFVELRTDGKPFRGNFAVSLIYALQEVVNLTIVHASDSLTKQYNDSIVYASKISGKYSFRTSSTNDLTDLADMILWKYPRYKFLQRNDSREEYALSTTNIHLQRRPEAGCPKNGSLYDAIPKIGILNRAKSSGRSLLNAQYIKIELERLLTSISSGTSSSVVQEVPIEFNEGKNFGEQIEFFRSVDIIISPHGAQLAGLFFLPTCGSVFELFTAGYYIPYYFGGLAEMSNKHHYSAYVYTANTNNLTIEKEKVVSNATARRIARKQNYNPQIRPIIDYVKNVIIQEWRTCCAAAHGNTTDHL